MIGAISFQLSAQSKAIIYLAGTYDEIEWKEESSSELGDEYSTYKYKEEYSGKTSIIVVESLDGNYCLRLVETKRYTIKLEVADGDNVELPKFQNENNKNLKLERDKNAVSFQFINYLGRARATLKCNDNKIVFPFEVIPDKIHYEDDYVELTEALAESCSELLLEYSGVTSNTFRQSDESAITLLEQFLFLRKFCYTQSLQGLFESVKRNPDRVLIHEDELKPFGAGIPSKKFYSNPFSNSRQWSEISVKGSGTIYLPREISVANKFDSLDTPANRFIKFALQRFDALCVDLIRQLSGKNVSGQTECLYEAKALHAVLDNLFRDSFFEDIGTLDSLPQNNQVLQKREGYSQIFHAYLMLDLAMQLDWRGKDEIYEGESKNVALLYEYWLFFELYKIIRSVDGCQPITSAEESFISKKGGLTVSLKEGKTSCQSFELSSYGLKINLYYNREFSSEDFKSTRYEGSYSRPFRPDYTLAVFPNSYFKGRNSGEESAVKDGAVSYIHFDAKYRIEDLTGIMGENLGNDVGFSEEKADSVLNTYKTGDLLKMHTYNDAIRRTVGSYVLYPGTGNTKSANRRFRLYDEILPGVGAFALKPSNRGTGETVLKDFIVALLKNRAQNDSRLNRANYYKELVISEPSVSGGNVIDNIHNEVGRAPSFVMGYIRGDNSADYYYFLKSNHFLEKGAQFPFYFYAIKGQNVYSHHKDVFREQYFRFYCNKITQANSYVLEPVLCKVVSNELLSKQDLVEKLVVLGYSTDASQHQADYYYVLTVEVVDDDCQSLELPMSEVNGQNGNDTFSPHSPKVVIC